MCTLRSLVTRFFVIVRKKKKCNFYTKHSIFLQLLTVNLIYVIVNNASSQNIKIILIFFTDSRVPTYKFYYKTYLILNRDRSSKFVVNLIMNMEHY